MQKAERHGGPTRLGSYEIVRPLARGGMAELFLARVAGPQTFEKLVVVKKILPKFADNPRFLQLFLDEAKLAASLSHKNIVSVHDVGGSGSESFFAMEYLHGQDVRSILHRAWKNGEKLPIPHAVQIAKLIADALHYAHEKRRSDGSLLEIVHRDVSPSNVIVSYDGAVKLVDFGVAKAATRTVKTRTGTLKGKIAYMSPEQARGAQIDRRSDVFSLGIVLWEMVTTSRLFRGENDLATLQLIINNPIKKPTEERPDCPAALERIVLKALSQDPERRYQSANEVARDLEELVRTEQLSQSSAGLSVYMSELFRHELDSWEVARAQGVPLGDHLTNVGELTTPISESDFVEAMDSVDLEDDEEDNEDSLGAVSGTIGDAPPTSPATVPGRRVTTPASGTAQTDRTPPPQLIRPTGPTGAPLTKAPGGTPAPQLLRQRPSSGGIPVVTPPQPGSGPVGGSGPIVARTPTGQRTDHPPRPSPPPRPPVVQISAEGGARADATATVTPLPTPTALERGRADITPVPQAGRGDPTALVAPLPPPQRDSSPWPTSPTPHGGTAQGSWPQSAQIVSLDGGEHFSAEQAQRLKKQFVRAGAALVAIVLLVAMIKACGGGGSAEKKDQPEEGSAVAPPTREKPRPAVTIDAGVVPETAPPDAAVVVAPPDAAETPVEPVPTKQPTKRPTKRPGTKRPPPPPKKFDPNAPLPPR